MMNDLEFEIGPVVFSGNEIEDAKLSRKLNDLAVLKISLRLPNLRVNKISFLDLVRLKIDGESQLAGLVSTAKWTEHALHLHCLDYGIKMNEGAVRGASRMNPVQAMRLITISAGMDVGDDPEDNHLVPERETEIDWDDLLVSMEEAANFLDMMKVVEDRVRDKQLRQVEQEALKRMLSTISSTLGQGQKKKVPVELITKRDYEASFPIIKSGTWHLRQRPDEYEVVAPIVDMLIPTQTMTVGEVTFFDKKLGNAVNQTVKQKEIAFLEDWELPTYARTSVYSRDFATARKEGLAKITSALGTLCVAANYGTGVIKRGEYDYQQLAYDRSTLKAYPFLADDIFILNRTTKEYWIGSLNTEDSTLDLSLPRQQVAAITDVLGFLASETAERTGFQRKIRQSLNWHYKAAALSSDIDRFLFYWISLETLLKTDLEDSSAVLRRIPFVVVSAGEKLKGIRKELQDRWIPLRNQVVHEAVFFADHAAEGAGRLQFLATKTLVYAAQRSGHFTEFLDWLSYLDGLANQAVRPRQIGN